MQEVSDDIKLLLLPGVNTLNVSRFEQKCLLNECNVMTRG